MKFVNENSGITHRLFPTNEECIIYEYAILNENGKIFRFECGEVKNCKDFCVDHSGFARAYVDSELSAFYWAQTDDAGYWDIYRLVIDTLNAEKKKKEK